MNELEVVAKTISAARKKIPMSQAELARKASLGVSTIERIEQARAPMAKETTLRAIANATGMDYETELAPLVQPPPQGRVSARDWLGDIPDDLAESFALLAESYGLAPVELLRKYIEADRLVIKE